MGLELGRVSGSLLASNLLRNGEDLAFESNLLYFDVTNRYIGVKNNIPSSQLHTTGTIRANSTILVDTSAGFANLSFLTNRIQNPIGPIYIRPNQTTNPTVQVPAISTQNLTVSTNAIRNSINNDNINITVNPTGELIFNSPLVNVHGNLHVTGDITWDYNITFTGDLSFSDEILVPFIPTSDNAYNLGLSSLPWANLYSVNVVSGSMITANLTANNINLLLSPGNIIYVSTNGADTNTGTHLHSPYKTIKHALSVATFGVEIVIFPGSYPEIFPLTIPSGVSLRGTSISAVTITPTNSTKYNDAFLLNGDTTVSFLTVANFFYDSVHNTGYAFRFATNFKSIAKSPYVYHVDVITRGSVVSPTDPYGFNQGDAGAGVYLDGSAVDPTYTVFPSGLFYELSLTVPNQNGLTATNGVRVEWINSGTYFAKNGIYLTTGILGTAGLGIKFGAELHSINGVNLYGTNGVVASGPHTIATLTNHYFGYIGSGNDSTNNLSLVIHTNEVIAISGGIIYYESTDQIGDFRVGDIFYVDQSTGNMAFTAQSIDFGSEGSIVFETSAGVVSVDKFAVNISNIRIYDNNIDSITGPVNLSALSNIINLHTNVNVTGLIDISGEVHVNGNVYLGNTQYDTVSVFPLLTQTIKPNSSNTYTLGASSTGLWRDAYLKSINVDSVTQILSNVISIIPTNTDLQLSAAGAGAVRITSDVSIPNNITVTGISTVVGSATLLNTSITGSITQTGDMMQTGATSLTGTLTVNNITLHGPTSYAQSASVQLYNNSISATSANANIQFTAGGSGGVIFENSLKFTNSTISNSVVSAVTDMQRSIIFAPNGTGNTVLNSTKALKLPSGISTSLTTTGSIAMDSVHSTYRGYTPSGLVSFTNLYSMDSQTYITPELSNGANDSILRFATGNVVRATIDQTKLYSDNILAGNVQITGNTIKNIDINSDLIIPTPGTGNINLNGILVNTNSIINNTNTTLTLSSTGIGYFKFAGDAGVVIPVGTNSSRRLTPAVGEIRYNTDISSAEAFDGTVWIPLAGTSPILTTTQVDDTNDIMALIFG